MVWACPRALGWQMTTVQERGGRSGTGVFTTAALVGSILWRLLLGAGSPVAHVRSGIKAAGSLCSVSLKADVGIYGL